MTEILNKEEIAQLLAAINGDDTGSGSFEISEDKEHIDFNPVPVSRKIEIYDFKRPYKFTVEQKRAILAIHETFARLSTNSLTAQLRTIAHVHVASVEQLTYEEFLRSIPTPTTLAIINMYPMNGNAIMEIDPAIAFAIIDRICGGTGENTKSQHELTDIEQSIMEKIIIRLLEDFCKAWNLVIDLHPRLVQIDTNPQFVQIIPPNEIVLLITLETKLGDVEGMINICIPYLTIKPIMGKLSIWNETSCNNSILKLSNDMKLNKREDITIRLTAELLRRDYPIKEILKWNTETFILPLRSISQKQCYLRLGDKLVWQCEILSDCKNSLKKIVITNYVENQFDTEVDDMKKYEFNQLVRDALSEAMIKITVELGTAVRPIKEVYEMCEGTIVELDKLAGEPVDIKANGVLIAKGEVVVVDENFGVRIIETVGEAK